MESITIKKRIIQLRKRTYCGTTGGRSPFLEKGKTKLLVLSTGVYIVNKKTV